MERERGAVKGASGRKKGKERRREGTLRTGSSVSMAELKTKSALFCEGMGSREALRMG